MAAGLLVGLMMLGVFTGIAYQFIVITGEKQLRVTEQVVSAITPQMWIDGKILGISLLAFCHHRHVRGQRSRFRRSVSRVFGDGASRSRAEDRRASGSGSDCRYWSR